MIRLHDRVTDAIDQGTSMTEGIITNIQRFSIHDGPGIRTTVFLKGCNLRCFWCHNPEAIRPQPEIQFFPERCIGCEVCAETCTRHGHTFDAAGLHSYDRGLCIGCGECAALCYAQALVAVGQHVSVADVMTEVRADAAFYASSGGGVTVSGGEPLLQADFTYDLLAACRDDGISTAIETAANVAWERIAALLPMVDLVMMDIKHLDSDAHRRATGVPNVRILANAQRLGQQPQPLIVRTPIVPGVNDTPEEVAAIAAFVARLPNLLYYELLPYHPMAKSKYRSLDLDYRADDLLSPTAAHMAALAEVVASQGIPARVG